MVWKVLSERRVDVRGYKRTLATVQCSCGYKTEIRFDSIGSGSSQCVFCARTKHGDSYTRFYKIWNNMMQRCYNIDHNSFDRYGGRGITVCNSWKVYKNFKASMYKSYCEHIRIHGNNTSIDRIDNDLGYSFNNCRWATLQIQCSNRRK